MSNDTEAVFDLEYPYGIELKLEGLAGITYFWFKDIWQRDEKVRDIRRKMKYVKTHPVIEINEFNIPSSRIIWWVAIRFEGDKISRDSVA